MHTCFYSSSSISFYLYCVAVVLTPLKRSTGGRWECLGTVTGNTQEGTGGQDLLQTQLVAGQPAVLVGQRHQDIHVVDGEEAGVAVQHPFVPVVIDLVGQGDDIAFLKA